MSAKLDDQLVKLQSMIAYEHSRYVAAASVAVAGVLAEFGLTIEDIATPEIRTALKKAVKQAVTPTEYVKKVKTTKPEKTATASTRMKKATAKAESKRGRGGVKGPQPAKYRDPVSGATWSGFARPPAWIAGEKDRTKFLINGAA